MNAPTPMWYMPPLIAARLKSAASRRNTEEIDRIRDEAVAQYPELFVDRRAVRPQFMPVDRNAGLVDVRRGHG